ncbi:MAG: hypothetical protein M1G31_01790 [Pseudanabaena sp. Salubria-1]|nr:hypothetical protein [Pseudanabaena sp. Salubria-1]
MPSVYQTASLNAILGLFLEAQRHPYPEHTQIKSASALSRFLNHYNWSTRAVILTFHGIFERHNRKVFQGKSPDEVKV